MNQVISSTNMSSFNFKNAFNPIWRLCKNTNTLKKIYKYLCLVTVYNAANSYPLKTVISELFKF